MYIYNLVQWLFIFYFYSFFGWCFESTYVSFRERRLVNRGFLRGPFLPIYGSGAVMMLLVSAPFSYNIGLVFLSGCFGATALEYVTGVAMEKLFNIKYWDYSNQKLNFQGHICLSSSVAWGGLTILMTEFIHKGVEHFILEVPFQPLAMLTLIITVYIAGDIALSFRTALDLKEILLRIEKIKEELVHVQKRLDVLAAIADDEWSATKAAFGETLGQAKEGLVEKLRIEELKQSIEEKLNAFKGRNTSQYSDEVKVELKELHSKYKVILDLGEKLSGIKEFYIRNQNVLRSNPSMSSGRFQHTLEELKKMAERPIKKKDKDTQVASKGEPKPEENSEKEK